MSHPRHSLRLDPDVATKRDLENLELRFEAKLDRAIKWLTLTLVSVMSGLFIALATLAFTAARLT